MTRHLFILVFSASLVNPLFANAQTSRGQIEFSVSYGLLSGKQVSDFITVTEDGNGIDDSHATGSTFVTGRYFVTDRLTLGLAIGNQQIQGEVNDNNINRAQYISSFNLSSTTIAAEIMLNYVNTRWFRFYTFAGIGAAFRSYAGFSNPQNLYSYGVERNKIDPTIQYTPLGFSFGGRLSYFLEFGLGYKGLINTGLSYRIGKQDAAPTRRHPSRDFRPGRNRDVY